jgi:hypothetical protein
MIAWVTSERAPKSERAVIGDDTILRTDTQPHSICSRIPVEREAGEDRLRSFLLPSPEI